MKEQGQPKKDRPFLVSGNGGLLLYDSNIEGIKSRDFTLYEKSEIFIFFDNLKNAHGPNPRSKGEQGSYLFRHIISHPFHEDRNESVPAKGELDVFFNTLLTEVEISFQMDEYIDSKDPLVSEQEGK